MNKYIILFFIGILSVISSCQKNDIEDNIGFLRIDVESNSYVDVNSRIIDEYNPKQLAVKIKNSKGETVKSVDDYSELSGQQIALAPDTYTIEASSYGFDGSESGRNIPYYYGSTSIQVQKSKEVTANIECTLANVKVMVNFDEKFAEVFKSANVLVSSVKQGVDSQNFEMGQDNEEAYFPVADLNAKITVVNNSGETYSSDTPINGVKARKFYILNFKLAETDNGNIGGVNVSVDGTETIYTFTFNVATSGKTSLFVDNVNAWSNFAFVSGSAITQDEVLDNSKMFFEYKKTSESEWTKVVADFSESSYSAQLDNLTPSTSYECRMSYQSEDNTYTSDSNTFTTESAAVLPNGNMDDWYKSDKTWYPVSEADYSSNGSFWDSSNPATTTGVGALVNKNPTQGNSTTVHTSGGQSAELKSQYASAFGIGKFAAASLYTGKFNSLVGANGAKIDFGQPFTSRPSALRGWFHYTNGKIDYRGDNTPEGVAEKGTDDLCSIYMAIAKQPHQLDNTQVSTFFDFENDPNIIAYGSLPDSEAVSTNGEWKEFNVELTYKDKTPLDQYYLIIVCSSSKYGDYFTGSTGSTMYIDDMELVYDVPAFK
ncbi:MAG: PCMD domain-containing protein [Candidatus Phocaeicola faecigallinarum]|uniref:PCMD domain-containing protein n=1 Tax=Candidatus Phocaeicola faecigallinarum TaxID=2838732 RepID=A0A948TBR9_9BACT|nr:PCMD domain-containing protein [Candidatus Phocaeicola faecigallinarum]